MASPLLPLGNTPKMDLSLDDQSLNGEVNCTERLSLVFLRDSEVTESSPFSKDRSEGLLVN